MPELIHEHATLRTPEGEEYVVRIYGESRPDGTWTGWLEFHPLDPSSKVVLRTDRETSQANREALVFWASGLEPVYLEGAFERAFVGAVP